MTTRVTTPSELADLVGTSIGQTRWYEITQHQIDQFADATRDHQWIHVNPNQASAGPFGGPIAHGFLTLSLIPIMLDDVLVVEQVEARVNYGLNRVRFTAPVPAGGQIRGEVTVASVTEKSAGFEVVFSVTVALQGSERPALVAESIVIFR